MFYVTCVYTLGILTKYLVFFIFLCSFERVTTVSNGITTYSFFVFHLTRNCDFNMWNINQSYIRNIFGLARIRSKNFMLMKGCCYEIQAVLFTQTPFLNFVNLWNSALRFKVVNNQFLKISQERLIRAKNKKPEFDGVDSLRQPPPKEVLEKI